MRVIRKTEDLKAAASIALTAIYIAVEEDVANDLNAKVKAYIEAIEAESEDLGEALKMLYSDTASYITQNNLGDVHHNQSMKMACAALIKAGKMQQTCKACGCVIDADGCGCNPHDA